ncbi:MAG: hypothetical protein LAP21_13360 [Acidobacteriia bacterium]|nr:hypothetical protein [Terriglobia bacterium]
MKSRSAQSAVITFATLAIFCATFSWPFQKDGPPATTVSILVSVEAKHGKEVPAIYREDVRVFHDQERLQVTGWTPMQGEQAGLELFMLIDDSSDTSVGSQLDDLSRFIKGQPATTEVAVGYIRNGTVIVTQNFTPDHALAAKALRIPLGSGGGMASPYLAITDLISRWPESPNRREIFMVSSGIDALQPGPSNSYLQETIEKSQRAGIQVYSIYASRAGHIGHSIWRLNWGQDNLSQLADETGGEAYFQGLQMPISFGPYLDQFADRLKHQFRLTFVARSRKEPGYQKIKLETEVSNAELVAADDVYVPAPK